MDFSTAGHVARDPVSHAAVPFLSAPARLYKGGRSGRWSTRAAGYVRGGWLGEHGPGCWVTGRRRLAEARGWGRDKNLFLVVSRSATPPSVSEAIRDRRGRPIGERMLEYAVVRRRDRQEFGSATCRRSSWTTSQNRGRRSRSRDRIVREQRHFFRGRPIETLGMENLCRRNASTPYERDRAAAAKAKRASPGQIDHAIRAYFGWRGTAATDPRLRQRPATTGQRQAGEQR